MPLVVSFCSETLVPPKKRIAFTYTFRLYPRTDSANMIPYNEECGPMPHEAHETDQLSKSVGCACTTDGRKICCVCFYSSSVQGQSTDTRAASRAAPSATTAAPTRAGRTVQTPRIGQGVSFGHLQHCSSLFQTVSKGAFPERRAGILDTALAAPLAAPLAERIAARAVFATGRTLPARGAGRAWSQIPARRCPQKGYDRRRARGTTVSARGSRSTLSSVRVSDRFLLGLWSKVLSSYGD